jgi:uncharacterized protein (TIGR02646 family)
VIHVRRDRTTQPAVLDGSEARNELAAAEAHFRRRSEPFRFHGHQQPEVRKRLQELFHEKCAYCESSVSASNPFDVEHYRPTHGALNLDGTVAPAHYWWLATEWTNLLPSCMYCNRSKRARFPIAGALAEPGAVGEALAAERPLLLDPCVDEPGEHLVFLEDGLVAPKTERGEITIDVLALNRESLVASRRETQATVKYELTAALTGGEGAADALRRAVAPTRPYAAMRAQFAQLWLERVGVDLPSEAGAATLATEEEREQAVERASRRAVRKQSYSVEAEDREDKEVFFAGKKFIEWIRIEDFKAINRLRLRFPPPRSEREPWLALVGENGTGKSSVLQAVALALMGQRHANELGLDAATFVRRDARRGWGRVQVKLATIPEPIEVRFRRSSPKFFCRTADPKVLLLGYGATRLLRARGSEDESAPPHVRIKNLFDPVAPLSDVESWLMDRRALSDRGFTTVKRALKDLLMLGAGDDMTRAGGTVEVILRGEPAVTLRQLSDGFQSVVALACDVMKSLLERFSDMEEAEGIVLVDELEAHLHPAWKIQIVERLRRAFPRVGFVMSTHDPLCLKGLDQGEIVVLRRDDEQQVIAIVDVPAVNHLRADQILTSPLFGLPSTRGDATTAELDRYSELLAKADRAPGEEKELQRLRARLDETLTTGESQLERDVARTKREMLDELAPRVVQRAEPAMPSPEELELRRQLDELLGVEP